MLPNGRCGQKEAGLYAPPRLQQPPFLHAAAAVHPVVRPCMPQCRNCLLPDHPIALVHCRGMSCSRCRAWHGAALRPTPACGTQQVHAHRAPVHPAGPPCGYTELPHTGSCGRHMPVCERHRIASPAGCVYVRKLSPVCLVVLRWHGHHKAVNAGTYVLLAGVHLCMLQPAWLHFQQHFAGMGSRHSAHVHEEALSR